MDRILSMTREQIRAERDALKQEITTRVRVSEEAQRVLPRHAIEYACGEVSNHIWLFRTFQTSRRLGASFRHHSIHYIVYAETFPTLNVNIRLVSEIEDEKTREQICADRAAIDAKFGNRKLYEDNNVPGEVEKSSAFVAARFM